MKGGGTSTLPCMWGFMLGLPWTKECVFQTPALRPCQRISACLWRHVNLEASVACWKRAPIPTLVVSHRSKKVRYSSWLPSCLSCTVVADGNVATQNKAPWLQFTESFGSLWCVCMWYNRLVSAPAPDIGRRTMACKNKIKIELMHSGSGEAWATAPGQCLKHLWATNTGCQHLHNLNGSENVVKVSDAATQFACIAQGLAPFHFLYCFFIIIVFFALGLPDFNWNWHEATKNTSGNGRVILLSFDAVMVTATFIICNMLVWWFPFTLQIVGLKIVRSNFDMLITWNAK